MSSETQLVALTIFLLCQTDLHFQPFASAEERNNRPFTRAHGACSEVAAVDHGRNTQTQGTDVFFEAGLDRSDDHVCHLADSVENLLIDGGELHAQQLP